jgi:lipoprotein signal peptidase
MTEGGLAMDEQTEFRSQRIIHRLYILASVLIFLGVIFMCQPFSMAIYTVGFPTVLGGTIGYIVLDHMRK